jgi:LysM repeat protein
MKKSAALRPLLFFVVITIFASVGVSVQAQAQNLLTNPGFEAPFNQSSGNPPPRVAQGWTPWWVSAGTGQSNSENIQPEYFPASEAASAVGAGVPQIRSGSDAQQYFTFFATHDGGVFQRVTGITSGAQLRFSVYAYVWSTTFDDPNFSEDDGDVILQVGIDPTGGTNGQSNNIVWSDPVETYDEFTEYTVTATASGTAVTVFVRSTVGFPVKSNSIYLDDASLSVAGGQSPTATTAVIATTAAPTATTASATAIVTTAAPTSVGSVPTATSTSVPPTAIGIIPTNTATIPPGSIVAPTFTSVPATVTSTVNAQPLPPTATGTIPPASIVAPTFTLTPTVPASATATLAPSATLPPTATSTIPPTATQGVPAPASATPIAQVPTATPITAATATITPTAGDGTGGPSPITDVFPGQVLHTVRRGDTVANLAVYYGSTTQAIIAANGLDESALIYVGQGVVVPVRLPAAVTSTPTQTPVVVVVTATQGAFVPTQVPTGGVSGTIYIVQRGDTLSRLATRFNTTVATIAQLNGIVNPNVIQVGQRIVIPGTVVTPPTQVAPVPTSVVVPTATPAGGVRTYTVQPGDNLFRISLRFGVPLTRLAQANGIFNYNIVYVGQVLVIP